MLRMPFPLILECAGITMKNNIYKLARRGYSGLANQTVVELTNKQPPPVTKAVMDDVIKQWFRKQTSDARHRVSTK